MLQPDDGPPIAAAFGLGVDALLEGPVARGELGQVWCLTTETGRYAVKEPFDPVDGSAVGVAEVSADFQERAIAASVPAPAVVRTPDGGAVLPIRSTVVRVYGWVDLRRPDRRLDPALVGEAVARLHRVGDSRRDVVDPWYAEPAGGWTSLAAEVAAASAPFADALVAGCDALADLDRLVVPPRRLQICHRDLFADNVLATRTGGVCIIDWESCGPADPSYELAVVLFEFADGDAERARALHTAYRRAGGTGRVDGPASFSMAIAQLGHIGHHAARSWLAAPDDDSRRHHEARMAEFLDDGLTRDGIELLLDAVAG